MSACYVSHALAAFYAVTVYFCREFFISIVVSPSKNHHLVELRIPQNRGEFDDRAYR